MSDIIHVLPDSVANQIAAGEVIQRPASIVKELVENALDAGATHIQVVVEDAGKSLVQVIDNGKGMSATDARLSFERHATSKIQQATDLFALRTMGFRGEALASIAAVAQVELRTRTSGDELGTSIHIEGSKVISQEPVSCPTGANFAVRNLFFNIPARRKFLKSNQTELGNLLAEFERIALAHPEVSFTLHSGQSVMIDLPAGNLRQRIIGIFGRKIDSQLIPIHTETTLARISGYVGMPAAARRKNAHQYLFVNGRFMRHPYFAKAILTAYERLIPEGYQIPFFIDFKVEPARIDVNIHPTKTEIKFEDDNAIFQILMASVREALGKYGAVPTIDFDVEGKPDIPTFEPSLPPEAITPPQIHINSAYNPFQETGPAPSGNGPSPTQAAPTFPSAYNNRPHTADWQKLYEEARNATLPPTDYSPEGSPQPSLSLANKSETSLYENLPSAEQADWNSTTECEFMQFRGQYIITPLQSGLALIDQHRAHIRVLYERYMGQLDRHQGPSQRLLFPEMLSLSPSESVMFEQIIPQLQEVGFDVSPLGSGSFSVLAVPTGTEGIAPLQLVHSILADAINGQANAAQTIGHIIALSLARKVAMPVGQVLSSGEMHRLVEQLFTCSTPNLTPEGAPTLIMLDPKTLF